MKYEEALELYERELQFIARITRMGRVKSMEELVEAATRWYHNILLYTDFKPYVAMPTDEEIKKFESDSEDFIGIIEYRGTRIPIYNDDYGQQIYAKFGDEIYSGGTYNTCAELDICMQADRVITMRMIHRAVSEWWGSTK